MESASILERILIIKRRKWIAKQKLQIVLKGMSGRVPLAELSLKHQISQAQYYAWRDPEKPIHAQGLTHARITVEDDVWIGGRVNITAGLTIAHGSVIGGGSVVTKDIPERSIAVGIPAKVIKSR